MNIFYPSVLTYVLSAQKNHLIETFLLSTHNVSFGCEMRKNKFWYTLLTKSCLLLLISIKFIIFLSNLPCEWRYQSISVIHCSPLISLSFGYPCSRQCYK